MLSKANFNLSLLHVQLLAPAQPPPQCHSPSVRTTLPGSRCLAAWLLLTPRSSAKPSALRPARARARAGSPRRRLAGHTHHTPRPGRL